MVKGLFSNSSSKRSKSSCTENCSCSSNGLGCTVAFKCMADEECRNPTEVHYYSAKNEDLEDSNRIEYADGKRYSKMKT